MPGRMTHRERLALLIASLLALIAVTALVVYAVLPPEKGERPREILMIAVAAASALGGALNLPHPTTGERNGKTAEPPADPPAGVPPRG